MAVGLCVLLPVNAKGLAGVQAPHSSLQVVSTSSLALLVL